MSLTHSLAKREEELFLDELPSERLLGYKPFKADMRLISNDTFNPVVAEALRMTERALSQVNDYLARNNLEKVGLPSYLRLKGIPEIEGFILRDHEGEHLLRHRQPRQLGEAGDAHPRREADRHRHADAERKAKQHRHQQRDRHGYCCVSSSRLIGSK